MNDELKNDFDKWLYNGQFLGKNPLALLKDLREILCKKIADEEEVEEMNCETILSDRALSKEEYEKAYGKMEVVV